MGKTRRAAVGVGTMPGRAHCIMLPSDWTYMAE